MTETPNSKLLNAIIILLIVLILVIVSSILSEKSEKYNDKNKKQTLEPFANFQDVKTKTINWCKKMQAVGLLTPVQYDECIASFKDNTGNRMPAEMPVPDTGLDQNFSLYNTTSADKSGKLSKSITGGNTNNVMLVTSSGLYMGCKPDNTIYFIKNINDATINQQELYFTLVPQTDNVYTIMSPYKRYLIANVNPNNDNTTPTTNGDNEDYTGSDNYTIDKDGNVIPITTTAKVVNVTPVTTNPFNTEWTASFIGTNIGPMSSWILSKVNNNITLESIQYSGFFMSFNDTNNSLEIIYGNNDSAMWTMVPEEKTDVNNKYRIFTGSEFIVRGENILQKLKNIHIQITCLNAKKNGLIELEDLIRTNYTAIATYMQQKLDSTAGLNNQDINTVLNKITNTRDYYIQQFKEDISQIDIILSTLNDGNVSIEFNNYLNDLQDDLNSVNVRIRNNNKIMGRQQDNYDKVNTDYADINQKTKKVTEIDETAKLNIDLVNNYNAQNSYLLYLYPVLILILGLALLYLIYITIIKFKENIYDKYL